MLSTFGKVATLWAARKFASGPCLAIAKEDRAPIREAYNTEHLKSFGCGDFPGLKQRVGIGEDEALKSLELKWVDGTLELTDAEKRSIQKSYLLAQDTEACKKTAREGSWRSMQILEAKWALEMVADTEQEKISIRNDFKLTCPKRVFKNLKF